MLNCKDMTKLISDSLDRKISFRQRMELWMHIMMCSMCRRFWSNARAMRRFFAKSSLPDSSSGQQTSFLAGATKLPADAKERIASAIQKELG